MRSRVKGHSSTRRTLKIRAGAGNEPGAESPAASFRRWSVQAKRASRPAIVGASTNVGDPMIPIRCAVGAVGDNDRMGGSTFRRIRRATALLREAGRDMGRAIHGRPLAS